MSSENDNKLVTLADLAEAYNALYNRDVMTEVLIKELSIQASNLPQTFTNQTGVETDMVCIKAELGTPSAQLGDWEVNTNTAGQIVISGSKAANVATTLKLYLMKSR